MSLSYHPSFGQQVDFTVAAPLEQIIHIDREHAGKNGFETADDYDDYDCDSNSGSSFYAGSPPKSPAFYDYTFEEISKEETQSKKRVARAHSVPTVPISIATLTSPPPQRTARSSSDPEVQVKGQRNLSRKQPPRLTESLELLSLMTVPAMATVSSSQPPFLLDVDLPNLPAITFDWAPVVAPHRPTKSIRRVPSNSSSVSPNTTPLARRIISSPIPHAHSPTSPSTSSLRASTIASKYIATPSPSLHHSRGSNESGRSPISCSSGSASACGTWSAVDDDEFSPKKRESRKARNERKRAEKAAFDVDTPPTMRALYEASLMDVIAEDGQRVKFGDLVRRGTTIVIFIRHCKCSNL